jgi:hypothetical protein
MISVVEQCHLAVGVAPTLDRVRRDGLVERRDVLGRELDLGRRLFTDW